MSELKAYDDALVGQTIASRYRIVSRLGAGGMGVAYRAWDERTAIPVVIKIPKAVILREPQFAERFAREIRLLQGLRHPHIVPILDVGDHQGRPFVVMRFLPGGSLSNRRLRHDDGKPRPNPPGMLHLWLPAVADALDYVHGNGVVHRDVKPANVFFDAFWRPFLGDFGIAKVVSETETFDREHTLTATHAGIGTQEYMAPEQFLAKAVLDGRTDQYALAVVVYEILSGSRPFTGSKAHVIVEIIREPVPSLELRCSWLPKSMAAAIYRGLAKDPAERFGSCREFSKALLEDVAPFADDIDVARLLCPRCSRILVLPVDAAGQKGRCPRCRIAMRVAKDLGALWLLDEARRQRRDIATVADSSQDVETRGRGDDSDDQMLGALGSLPLSTPSGPATPDRNLLESQPPQGALPPQFIRTVPPFPNVGPDYSDVSPSYAGEGLSTAAFSGISEQTKLSGITQRRGRLRGFAAVALTAIILLNTLLGLALIVSEPSSKHDTRRHLILQFSETEDDFTEFEDKYPPIDVTLLPPVEIPKDSVPNTPPVDVLITPFAMKEQMVDVALQWIANHQLDDGSWSFDLAECPDCGGQCSRSGVSNAKDRCGATAMALLPFLGRGYTHRDGKFKKTVAHGIAYLAKLSAEGKGKVYREAGTMYSQGLASLALSECYAMTEDSRLVDPTQAALNFIMHAQDHSGGGLRGSPKQRIDMLAIGWQIMALKSGNMAGLDVDPLTLRRAIDVLDSAESLGGIRYEYSDNSRCPPGITAAGVLGRMYLGWESDPTTRDKSVAYLSEIGPMSDLYYDYYVTQIMHHTQGSAWITWNRKMKGILLKSQSTEGHEAGSWYEGVDGGPWASAAGRLYCTSLATMILEVYYQHLPIYRAATVNDNLRE